MWTNENRARYDRSKLRYPSDLTDEEWAIIAPLIPPAKKGGNKRTVDERGLVDGLMYILTQVGQSSLLRRILPESDQRVSGSRWRVPVHAALNVVPRRISTIPSFFES